MSQLNKTDFISVGKVFLISTAKHKVIKIDYLNQTILIQQILNLAEQFKSATYFNFPKTLLSFEEFNKLKSILFL